MLVSAAPASARIGHSEPSAVVPSGIAGSALLTEWRRKPLSMTADDPASPFNKKGCRYVAPLIALHHGENCVVRKGTWILIPVWTTECSNIEDPPYHADTPVEAARCGLESDRTLTGLDLTLDGQTLSMLQHRFETFMLSGRVIIPENPIYGGTPGSIMRFGGHGFTAFIKPLPVGTHPLSIHVEGLGDPFDLPGPITVTR